MGSPSSIYVERKMPNVARPEFIQKAPSQYGLDLFVLPTVYGPMDGGHFDFDYSYYDSVLNLGDFRTNPGRRVLVIGAGSGIDLVAVYLGWLKANHLSL